MTTMRKGTAVRRAVFAVAAAAVAAGSLAACSSGGTAAGGGADDIESALEQGGEITYWSWTPSAEAQVAAF